jgi:hypothetical protein
VRRLAAIVGCALLLATTLGVSSVAGGLRVPVSHRDAVEEVLAVMRDLGVTVPGDVQVYVYDTPAAFRRGLLEDAYVRPDRADEIAAFAAGLARPGRVLLSAPAAPGRREWRRLLAHELTHVAQFALAGGDGRADQWLAEGFAERVAFEVLERMGLDNLTERRHAARIGVRRHPGLIAGRLDLAALGSPREFTLRHQRDGSVATYQLTFLLADHLVERFGLDGVLDYFRRCRTLDPRRAFEATFGQSLGRFETEMLHALRAPTPPPR